MTMYESFQALVATMVLFFVITAVVFFVYIECEPKIKNLWKKCVSKIVHITH